MIREEQLIRRYGAEAKDAPADLSALIALQAARARELVRRLDRDCSVAVLGDPVGTGKTVVALTAAARLLERGTVDRTVVVTPNDEVRRIWQERAENFGAVFDATNLHVVTATQLKHQPRARRTRVLVVVDEAHRKLHREVLADFIESGPGGRSHRRLLLSATPFQISVSALAELVGLGDREGTTAAVTEVLGTYGTTVTRVAKRSHEELSPQAREELRRAARDWSKASHRVLMPNLTDAERQAIGLTDPDLPEPAIVPIDDHWAEAFHVARLLPELALGDTGRRRRATDAFQRGLASSTEAFTSFASGNGLWTPALAPLRKPLEDRLGSGRTHPKVDFATKWITEQVGNGSHVAVFCVWTASAKALKSTVEAALEKERIDAHVVRPPGDSIPNSVVEQFRDPAATPMVLILQERFSESIDLDRGEPALVHYDLPWNPARLRQRWGRFVRASSNFTPIPKDKMLIPVLDHESDRRVCETVMKRMAIGEVLLSKELALRDDRDAEIDVTDEALRLLRTT